MTTSEPKANGLCWCGCGGRVGPGKFFLPDHDRFAEAHVVRSHYGSIAAFLAHHGYGPGGKNARLEAGQLSEDLLPQGQVAEAEEDAADVEEAERRLADPEEVPIPYDQARRNLGLT